MFVFIPNLQYTVHLGVTVCLGAVKSVDESVCVRAVRLRIRTNRKGFVLPDLLLHSDLEIRYATAPVGDLVGGGGGCFVRVKVFWDVCWGFY